MKLWYVIVFLIGLNLLSLTMIVYLIDRIKQLEQFTTTAKSDG